MVMRREKRNNNIFSASTAKKFSEAMDRMGLVDLPLMGLDGPDLIKGTHPLDP